MHFEQPIVGRNKILCVSGRMYSNMEIAVKLVIFGCIFSLAMASWIPGRPPPKIEDYSNEVNEQGVRSWGPGHRPPIFLGFIE